MLGKDVLEPSKNKWDWLGEGVYFWEHNPVRAVQYAAEVASGSQFNKKKISQPFIIGAIIDLGNCLNLTENDSLITLREGYNSLVTLAEVSGQKLPKNNGPNRMLDCAVIQHIHASRKENDLIAYDTVRGAFHEGEEIYPGSELKNRTHLQICVRNTDRIKGYFLPQPIEKYNASINWDAVKKVLK